jgi:hypothetical protein
MPDDCEVWGMTGLVQLRPVTAVFDMHDLEWTKEQWLHHYRIWMGDVKSEQFMVTKCVIRWHNLEDAIAKINEQKIQLYSVRKYDHIPTSIEYPIKEMIAHFGEDYFASSFDYAIALAIYQEYERIDVYGAKMCAEEEYAHQKASFTFWLGVCKGLGITFKIHGETELMTTKQNLMYGYNTPRMVRNE